MIYFKFQQTVGTKAKCSFLERIVTKLLKAIIPLANPTLDGKLENVKIWYIEYNDVEQYTNREIGIDNNGLLVFKAPCGDNLGYWCDTDLTLDDYSNFNIHFVPKEEFETKWSILSTCSKIKVKF